MKPSTLAQVQAGQSTYTPEEDMIIEEAMQGEAETHNVNDFSTNKEAQERGFKIATERTGKCPDCKELHTYNKKVGTKVIPWPSEHFKSCPRFMAMSPTDKAKQIEKANGCPKCTS